MIVDREGVCEGREGTWLCILRGMLVMEGGQWMR
jgi:hypothetical protein